MRSPRTGYFHRLIYQMSSVEFYKDARAARELLEDVSGKPVRGFRAPAFSVTERTPWFFDKLVEAGYRYDLSCVPGAASDRRPCDRHIRALHREDARGRDRGISDYGRPRILQSPCAFSGGGYLRLGSLFGDPNDGPPGARRRPPGDLLCASA